MYFKELVLVIFRAVSCVRTLLCASLIAHCFLRLSAAAMPPDSEDESGKFAEVEAELDELAGGQTDLRQVAQGQGQ